MRRSKLLTVGLLIMLAGPAVAADCTTGPFLSPSAVQTAFDGKYLYDVSGNPSYDELHHISASDGTGGSGSVDEYKKGPSDPVDPSVVNYATITIAVDGSGNAMLTYNYISGFTTPALKVVNSGSSPYTFCNGATVYTTSVASGSHG